MYIVYGIFNIFNGKFYIGKTNNYKKRKAEHIRLASNGSNDCPKLYNAIRKYGIDSFVFSLIQEFSLETESLSAEKYYINYFNSIDFGYNCLEDIISRIGYITSEETKLKQSISRINFYENNAHPNLGKAMSDVTKQKISQTLTGKYFGENIKNSKLTNIQRVEIIKLSDEGFHQREIARKYKVSQWSVWNVIKNREKFTK